MGVDTQSNHPAAGGFIRQRDYPFQSHHLDVEGGRMHYLDEGAGPAIVFLHGCPDWSYVWRKQILSLSKNHRCIAVDHIGFGLSEKPKGVSHSPVWHAQNLAKLVDHLNLPSFSLVLHDYGGPIGLSYAIDQLDRVNRMFLINTWAWDISEDPTIQRITRLANTEVGRFAYQNLNHGVKGMKASFQDREAYTPEFEQAMLGPFRHRDHREAPWVVAKQLGNLGPWFNEIWSHRNDLALKPITFMWGLRDPLFGERYLDHWWHEFPLMEVQRYDTAGHYLMVERPYEVAQTIELALSAPTPHYLS